MAILSVLPRLIVLFNFDCVRIPLDMLKKNELDIVIDKTRLLGSPIVHARTNAILNVMRAICIPYNDCFPNYFQMNFVEVWLSSKKPADFFLFGEEYKELS